MNALRREWQRLAQSAPVLALPQLLGAAAFGAWLCWSGLVDAVGPQDNDWPLLMWLVKHASWSDPSPLAIGHYGPGQLLLAWWLYPVFGSTLTAAKVMNAFCTAVCAWLLAESIRPQHGRVPALLVMLAFVTSRSALLTGQSEFGDPLATAPFLAGIYWWWKQGERRGLLAGVLLGSSGLIRTHFVFFSLGSAALAALLTLLVPPGGVARRAQLAPAAALVAGALLGNLPGFLLNIWVHGQPGSAIAHTFIGQVLHGQDAYDMFRTYAAHPIDEVLREEPLAVLHLMYGRALENPWWWGIPLGTGCMALASRTRWPESVWRKVLLMSGLALAYFSAFVTVGWMVTNRLLFPLTALNCWLALSVLGQLCWGKFKYSKVACAAAFAAVMFSTLPVAFESLDANSSDTRTRWQVSTELVQALRERGMRDAREAFVFDWDRFVVDDPELQPFYNFGFWNLLLPKFREERPVPTPYLGNLKRFSKFMLQQKVRFIVVPKSPQRFEALVPLVEDNARLRGYRRDAELTWDILYVRDEH